MTHSPRLLTLLVVLLGVAVGALLTRYGFFGETVLSALFSLGLVQLTDDQRQRAAGRIREALRRADITLGAAAADMRMDQAELTRALAGERKLDLYRLEMLPDVFWREYWPLLARDKGLPDIFHTWMKALPMVLGGQERSAL